MMSRENDVYNNDLAHYTEIEFDHREECLMSLISSFDGTVL